MDSARLPVAWVAGVDEDDGVEVAREPDGRAQPRRSPAHDRGIVQVCFCHAGRKMQEAVRPLETAGTGTHGFDGNLRIGRIAPRGA